MPQERWEPKMNDPVLIMNPESDNDGQYARIVEGGVKIATGPDSGMILAHDQVILMAAEETDIITKLEWLATIQDTRH